MKDSFDADYLVQTMPCACLVFGDKGTIEFVNIFICDVLGYDPSELVGQKLDRVLTLASRLFYQTHFFPLLRLNGKVSEIFFTLRSKTGENIPVMVNATRDVSGEAPINLCIFITVWERQKYENELLASKKVLQKALDDNKVLNDLTQELEEHQQKLDRQIAALIQRNQEYVQLNKVLSHDLQEPIRKIALYSDIMLNKEEADKNSADYGYVLKIQSLVTRLHNLTHCLQEFVSVESNDEPLATIDLLPLIKKAKAAASKETDVDEFEFEVSELPSAEVRAAQIQLLFTELIKNSIQNRREDTPLHIRIHCAIVEENSYQFSKDKYSYTDHLKLEITDNGTGFDSRYSTYVMGLFNKLNAESKGMGMGLALCKQIVSKHNGSIQVRAREQQGSTFIITLPLVQPHSE